MDGIELILLGEQTQYDDSFYLQMQTTGRLICHNIPDSQRVKNM